MQDDGFFEDAKKVQVLTPYRKLRKLRGWSLEEAAEQFKTSRHTLINIELAAAGKIIIHGRVSTKALYEELGLI